MVVLVVTIPPGSGCNIVTLIVLGISRMEALQYYFNIQMSSHKQPPHLGLRGIKKRDACFLEGCGCH